ncbi:hypothetical protein F5B20DRAFT_559891 [Whalleya microplaca]|nr:hypothetical protein F5B20DRAFT_559891 [Whalleya microplaca]
MLGRLEMGVDDCIKKYLEVSSAAFQRKRPSVDLLGRAKGFLKGEGAYQSDQLAAEFKRAAYDFEGDESAKLLRHNTTCKVFVCSYEKAFNRPTRFRTYSSNANPTAYEDCTIWEAARATSAAATFFDPMIIGRQAYVDGATGLNNPVEIVVEEARCIWPNALPRIQCIVSIGTGVPELKDFGDNLKDILYTLKSIATETEQTHRRFLKNHEDLGLKGRYFRFNVSEGLSGVKLDDYAMIGTIEAATRAYLDSPEVQSAATSVAATTVPDNNKLRYPTYNASLLKNCVPGSICIEDKDKVLEWLPYSDQQQFYNDASTLRTTEHAGNWFIEGDFEAWRQGPGSLLWLYADAGSGKTVLTSTIIDNLETRDRGLLAYYYFSFQRKKLQNIRDFKYALLVQLIKRLSRPHESNPESFHIPQHFTELRNMYYPSRSPKMKDLDKTILDIIGESTRTFIVIDALDECDTPKLRYDILEFVEWLLKSTTADLYVLVTSRPQDDIELTINQLSVAKKLVAFNPNEVDSDIRSHLEVLMKDTSYRRWSKDLQEKVINHITERSGGIFRWADLQVQELRGKSREVDVTRALKRLPKDLGETYKRMLERIQFNNYGQEALAVLRWLARAQRGLRLIEVAEIAAFEICGPSSEALSPETVDYEVKFVPQNRFDTPEEIFRILSGLITISRPLTNDDPLTDSVISFSHFSVREYLQSNDAPSAFRLKNYECDWFIIKSCLAYIDDYDTLSFESDPAATHPLLQYAYCRVWDHINDFLLQAEGDLRRKIMNSISKLLLSYFPKGGNALAVAFESGWADPLIRSKFNEFVKNFSENNLRSRDANKYWVDLLRQATSFENVRLLAPTQDARY